MPKDNKYYLAESILDVYIDYLKEVTMKWQHLIGDIYTEISRELERALDGLTVDDLNQQPDSGCNSIGWLAWHLTRCQDVTTGNLTGEEQLWVKENWHDRFGRIPDPADTGWHHNSEDVAGFKSPDGVTLMEYHRAVLEKTLHYINNKLTEADLERVYENSTSPGTSKVHTLLVGIISDNLQHVGQVAYLRGLLRGKGWSDE